MKPSIFSKIGLKHFERKVFDEALTLGKNLEDCREYGVASFFLAPANPRRAKKRPAANYAAGPAIYV
jgi:hypothetical protein